MTLLHRNDGKVDWRASFPREHDEAIIAWRHRLKSLRSHHAFKKAYADPARRLSRQIKHRDWESNNAGKILARTKRNYDENRARILWWAAKRRAEKKGLSFDLLQADVAAALDRGVCQATGLPLDLCGRRSAYSPSIDRRNPDEGYTRKNSWLVCWGFNSAKYKFSMADVIAVAEAIVKNKYDLMKGKAA